MLFFFKIQIRALLLQILYSSAAQRTCDTKNILTVNYSKSSTILWTLNIFLKKQLAEKKK